MLKMSSSQDMNVKCESNPSTKKSVTDPRPLPDPGEALTFKLPRQSVTAT